MISPRELRVTYEQQLCTVTKLRQKRGRSRMMTTKQFVNDRWTRVDTLFSLDTAGAPRFRRQIVINCIFLPGTVLIILRIQQIVQSEPNYHYLKNSHPKYDNGNLSCYQVLVLQCSTNTKMPARQKKLEAKQGCRRKDLLLLAHLCSLHSAFGCPRTMVNAQLLNYRSF